MKPYLFIVNPHAGKQKDCSSTIRRALTDRDFNFDLITTGMSGDARKITSQQAHRYRAIIAVGGDGTINEIINALPEEIPLGIIAMGSGNDFARSLNLPINHIAASLDTIKNSQIKTIDLGEINGIRFINAVGIGFDGYVNHLSTKLHWIHSGLKYYVAILLALFQYQPQTIQINQQASSPAFMLSINNGVYVGNGLPTAPNAQLNDGKLDLILVNQLKKYRLISQFQAIRQGKILSLPEVKHQLIDNIQITSPHPLSIHYDGEVLETTCHVSIRILPNALQLIHPQLTDKIQ